MLDPDDVAYYELFANSAVFICGTILKGYVKVWIINMYLLFVINVYKC